MRSGERSVVLYEGVPYNNVMYTVYILQSLKDATYYTGVTENLKGRMKKHNAKYSTYSSAHAPFKLVWWCCFMEKRKALCFEKYLKTGSGIAFRNSHLF